MSTSSTFTRRKLIFPKREEIEK